MSRTVQKTIFQFDELSDDAKEKARDWFRASDVYDDDASCTYEDAAQCAEILGIDLRTRSVKLMGGGTRFEPCIWYSGFSSQGDGACFDGAYRYAKGAHRKIRAHAPQDRELHRIADELFALQRKASYRLEASTKHVGRYYHAGCMEVKVWRKDDDETPAEEETLTQLLRDFADWIYDQLRKEWEWRNEDEQVDDTIRANEYEFDEDGARA